MPDNNTSFIPKADTLTTPTGKSRRSGGNVLALISTGLLILVVLAGAGLFGYQKYKQSQLKQHKQELQQARAAFDSALISDLNKLETRINTAKQLLDNHVAISQVFPIIESVSLANVQFTKMKITSVKSGEQNGSAGDSGDVVIKLSGVGPGYATVAMQSSELAQHSKINNTELSDFSLNKDGNVVFSVMFTIPKGSVRYTNTI